MTAHHVLPFQVVWKIFTYLVGIFFYIRTCEVNTEEHFQEASCKWGHFHKCTKHQIRRASNRGWLDESWGFATWVFGCPSEQYTDQELFTKIIQRHISNNEYFKWIIMGHTWIGKEAKELMNYSYSFSTDVINITWCQRQMKNFEIKKKINYEGKAPEHWRRWIQRFEIRE